MAGKTMLAVSKVEYRGVTILETAKGCSFVVNGTQYDFRSLSEATESLDKAYAAVKAVMETAKQMEALMQ